MTQYSEETKAAVMAALLTGQSVSSVAREYSIPKGTVGSWKHQAGHVEGIATQKRERIGVLLVEYLEANLAALRIQTKVFSDETWLKRQTGSDAAVLHGVLTDKAIRLLEAFGANEDNEEADAT